jgi:hypothetical protein
VKQRWAEKTFCASTHSPRARCVSITRCRSTDNASVEPYQGLEDRGARAAQAGLLGRRDLGGPFRASAAVASTAFRGFRMSWIPPVSAISCGPGSDQLRCGGCTAARQSGTRRGAEGVSCEADPSFRNVMAISLQVPLSETFA